MKKQLARITGARLEIKERGILMFYITVNYEEGCSQSVGGLALDNFSKEKDTRVGTAYGCEMIRRVLLELDVDDFSEMKDLMIWVYGEGEGFNFSPKGVSRLKVDKGSNTGLIFEDVYKEFTHEFTEVLK